ncbi:hypothetical protein E4U42_002869 [Claviceps africana]|uniref:Uncharacterized protein n=1 Tax=Claviceps africana TaxID=83212 RepID=A0A8K0NPD3_9HYPO|nr:hypothetical protein E4U42_002869 [Claviceps africana]
MTTPDESDYDLLTEHFGYPPVALLDDIINTVNVLADRALDSVERVLLSLPPSKLGFKTPKAKDAAGNSSGNGNGNGDGDGDGDGTPASAEAAAKREIENGTHQLETLLNAAIDKNFDIFELYTMNNILTIDKKTRPFIKLSHYAGLDLSKHPDKPTMGGITQLRRQLHASQKLHVALEAERSKNDALLRKLREALNIPSAGAEGDGGGGLKKEAEAGGAEDEGKDKDGGSALGFLRDKGTLEQGGTDKPITTTAEFALSQLQSLRSLSSSLTALLPQLQTLDHDGNSGSDNPGGADTGSGARESWWRRDRSEYIEGASRKFLERTVGLELGPQGEVRDGEWQGGGPSATKSEVESLERVSSILGTKAVEGAAAAAAEPGNANDDEDRRADDHDAMDQP